jgi:hypothetical protein
MSFFYRPHYDSVITQFLQQIKSQNPDLEARQRQGRSLLWDKLLDRSLWQQYRCAQVPQKPYVYQTNPPE